MKAWIAMLALALLSGLNAAAWAGEAKPNAEDPAIEQRLVKLAEDLRCLVCQNESLAGSHAELAEDLRREIREQMKQGKSDTEVVQYLIDRYGDFVLYKPPFKPVTWLLWLGPLMFVGIGAGAWWVAVQRRRQRAETALPVEAGVDAAQMEEARRLLADVSGEKAR
jgi:cytochrome c-type biogenesis protein CcmH